MSRRDTLLEIAESFEDDFTVSLEPDLPELFEGPDVLAGKSGRLIAVFVPKSHELRRPELLRTRLVLSRLALPDHTHCLLAIEDAYDTSRIDQSGRDFDAVVGASDRAELRRLRSKSEKLRHIPASTRQMVERRAAFLMTLSLAHQPQLAAVPGSLTGDWESDDATPVPSSPNGTSAPAHVLLPLWPLPLLTPSVLPQADSTSIDVFDGVLVARGAGARGSIHECIRRYLTVAAQTAFRIDHGVPYLGHPTAGIFIVKDARWPHVDPMKPVRASAFAGWALLSNPSRESLSESVREASRWLVGTVSERA